MFIMTFGLREENARVCDVVHVGVVLTGGRTRQLSSYAAPMICEPFTCQPVAYCQVKYQHLAGLAFANSSNGQEQLEVDILIGCDQYWSLITQETRQGESGPAAILTELGKVLSGPVGLATQDLPHTCDPHTTH